MRQMHSGAALDSSPIAALYDRYAHIILNYISRYISSREDVDDIVLDVFLAAMENQVWITWSNAEQLAWLRRIAYNKAVDYYRRITRHPSVALEHVSSMLSEDDEYMPEQVALRNEDYALLRVHLSNLSELQQQIVLLRFRECHLYAPDQSSANARLLHDLQHLAQDDVRRLAHIRERLVEHVSGNMQRQPVPLQRYHNTHAWPPHQPDSRHAKRQSLFLVKLMSGIAAMLVIGSMLGVVTLLRSHSEQGNSNHKPPASTPIIHGMAAFLMDATSGKVLVDVNSHAHLPIASTAKIMTAVVAIENANLDQSVTIEQAILDEVPQGMRTAQLQAGDQIQLRDLLYGLLLPTGSDAALVIAHAVAGNTQNFVMMMNDEAHQLQLNDTHFSNPYGFFTLDDYSSAADLTRLASYAMQLSTFAQVVAEQKYALSASSHNHRYVWHTTNTLLATYPGMNGIETGYDVLAGACMVFSAQRANRLLIGTVLHTQSKNVLNSAVKKLLDQGFAS